MKLHAKDFEGPGPFTVMAIELAQPKDDWSDTVPLEAFRNSPAGGCPFHGPACGSTEEREAEIRQVFHALDGVRREHELRQQVGVAAGPSGNSHVCYVKFDSNGLTYRVGAARDLGCYDDYEDWDCRVRLGWPSAEPLQLAPAR
jgi:hypothetical protein